MSTRIHELAKKYNQEPKELLAWLKERGFVSADTKSVSSTVSKIYFDELDKAFGDQVPPLPAPPPAPAPAVVIASATPEPSRVNIPSGVFVKSTQDLAREKEAAAEAKAALAKSTAPAPSPTPMPVPVIQPPRAILPMPPRPNAAPPPVVMPSPVAKSQAALPVLPPRSAPPVVSPPLAKPVVSVAPAAPSTNTAAAPASKAPVALPAMPARSGSSPIKAPPLPGAAPVVSIPLAPVSASVTVTQVGDVKLISMKPPVIVRDFATALGMRPFQLISELMQMGIFAAITQSLDEAIAAKLAEKHGFVLEVKHRGDPAVA